MLTKVGDCEGYLDMTSTRLSTPSTSGTASKCSTRWKLPRRRCKCNALCVLVPGQGLCQRARQALISPPHPPPVQGLSQFRAKFPNITPLSFLQHQLQHFLEGRSGDLLVQLQDHQQLQRAVVEPARDDDLELGDERGRAAVDQYKRAGPCNQGAPTIAF